MARILMVIAADQFRDEEYFDTRAALDHAGHETVVASTRTGRCSGSRGGHATAETTIDVERAADYDAVVFIGGSGSKLLVHNADAQRLALEADAEGKLLAAICHAPVILAAAGLLAGRRATVTSDAVGLIEAEGASYTGAGVTVDGRIVTADGPNSAAAFGRRIAELVGQSADA